MGLTLKEVLALLDCFASAVEINTKIHTFEFDCVFKSSAHVDLTYFPLLSALTCKPANTRISASKKHVPLGGVKADLALSFSDLLWRNFKRLNFLLMCHHSSFFKVWSLGFGISIFFFLLKKW